MVDTATSNVTIAIVVIILIIATVVLLVIMGINTQPSNTANSSSMLSDARAKDIRVVPASQTISNDEVPHTVHQIWLGSRPVPAATNVWEQLCRKYGYRYKLWRESDLMALRNQKYYEKMITLGSYQGASDVARYEVLYDEGGLYSDADIT